MSRMVTVRRTGGFAGVARAGELDLDAPDDARAAEVATLLESIDVESTLADEGTAPGERRPDGFHYEFDLCGERCAIAEHQLSPQLRRIATLVLESGSSA
jgi:hypothetical protein